MPRPSRPAAPPPAPRVRSRRHGRGGTLLGVFIGLVLGIVIALAVALFVTGGWKSYQQLFSAREAREAPAPAAKTAKAESDKPRFDFYKILPGGEEPKVQPPAAKPPPPDKATVDKAAGKAPADKAAEKGTDKAAGKAPADKAAEKGSDKGTEKVASAEPSTLAAKAPDRFWLQAGSFVSEADADNLKARLALAGWEAQVQRGELPDKGVRFRVRLGPYDNTDELNRVKGDLARRGFDVAVIRY